VERIIPPGKGKFLQSYSELRVRPKSLKLRWTRTVNNNYYDLIMYKLT